MTEVEIKHRDRILEAIDQLRRRKARPDSPRICNYMMRRFSVDCKDTKSDLEKCIEKKIVIKVEYKGDISYRNAAKWNHKHKPGDVIETSPDSEKNIVYFLNTLNTAISELIFQEPDYLELGIPGPELIRTILQKSSIKYSKKQLFALIQKEVDNGGLIKLENGNFSVGSMPMEAEKSDDDFIMPDEINVDCLPNDRTVDISRNIIPQKIRKKPGPKPGRKKMFSKENMTVDKSFGSSMGYRVGGRKKLAKKVFDPSDNNLPKRKRGRPVGSLNRSTLEKQAKRSPPRPASVTSNSNKIDLPTGGVCSVCHQAKKGFNEKLISCRDCINKAHVSCLHSEDGMLRLLPDNTWQCPHCKTCVTCFETSDAGILTVCSVCSDAYHSDCHDPKIIDTGISKWLCYHCRTPNDLIPNEIKPKIENSDFDEKIHNGSVSPTHSENANQFQPERSPSLPPTLSPQANRIVDDISNCSSNEYKFHISISGNEDISGSRKSSEFTEENYDPNIPDATNWTYEDVFHYFDQYFPNEACVFREQEIDGHSLLLMKRTDVLSSLNLKLGPALKIYRHVLKLQVRRDDPKLGWF